jgi:excisionase family DNA binding protein
VLIPETIHVTMPQRATIQTTRPGVPAPRPMGRPISAASLSRPVPAAHPASMPVGRPAQVPAPRAAVAFLTVAEVAALMRVSKMTVYRLVHSGELPAVRVGRSFRVSEEDVNEYLKNSFFQTG